MWRMRNNSKRKEDKIRGGRPSLPLANPSFTGPSPSASSPVWPVPMLPNTWTPASTHLHPDSLCCCGSVVHRWSMGFFSGLKCKWGGGWEERYWVTVTKTRKRKLWPTTVNVVEKSRRSRTVKVRKSEINWPIHRDKLLIYHWTQLSFFTHRAEWY